MTSPFLLPIDQPLDLPSTLASGQCFRWRQDASGAWTGVVGCDVVRLRMTGNGLAVESAPTPPAELVERLLDYLRLDDDLPALHARLGGDAQVAKGIAHYPGLRLLRQDPWETLAGFILLAAFLLVLQRNYSRTELREMLDPAPYEAERALDPRRWPAQRVSESRCKALAALGELGVVLATEELERLATQDPDPNVRRAAMELRASPPER